MAETFGEAVKRLRELRGHLTLRELARRANIDPGHLSRIEAGRRLPTPAIAAAIDHALAADGALVALTQAMTNRANGLSSNGWGRSETEALAAALVAETPTMDNALRLAHEWLVIEPPQVYELRAGRRIGVDVVEKVKARVQQLRLLDDHVGGMDTYDLVTAELDATVTLLREAAYTESVGRRLLGVVSELCQVAGWVTSDAGRTAEATRFYLAGVRAAHAAGDEPGAASNLSSLAYQAANIGDPRQAVTLAASAVRGTQHAASATSRAVLLDRLAWTHARAGDSTGADRALGRVDEAYSDRHPEDDPAWAYWLNEDEIAVMAGRCWTQLRRPLRAVPVLERATAAYGQDTARESALYLSWLAEALIQANEVEQAAVTAGRALELAGAAHSARTAGRLDEIHNMLTPYRGTPVVDAFDEAYRAHQAA
jgi:transcriptional regulator with XRE-family HTH domain